MTPAVNNHRSPATDLHAEGRTVLILGASPDQMPLYLAAKRVGARIVGADANPNALSRPLTDRFLVLNSRAAEDIVDLLGEEPIHGVASPGNDSFHQTIRDLCGLLDLPNRPSQEAVDASCDKGYFSTLANGLGLFAPSHCMSTDLAELADFVASRPMPLIVKPADSSGSKGLSFLTSPDDLPAAFEKAAGFSPKGLVIVEDYIPGDQFGVEAFILNGRCVLAATSRRGHTGPPDFLVTQHRVGFPLPDVLETQLVPAIGKIARRLGIANGPINFDLVHHPERGLCFIEMGARLSGNGFPALVQATHDVDTTDWVLRLALGRDLPPLAGFLTPKRLGVQQVLGASRAGRLRAIVGLDQLKAHPAFRRATLFVEPGGSVQAFTRTVDRLGVVLLAHEDRALVDQALDDLQQKVVIQIDSAAEQRQEETA